MTIAPADFLTNFPVFNNATYTGPQIAFWIGEGYSQLNAYRFGVQLDIAVQLFTAHNLVEQAREARTVASGGLPGAVTGPIASKSVGPLSTSYSGATSIEGAGIWNSTTYGQRLYQMMRSYAVGPKSATPFYRRPGSGRGGYGGFGY